MPAALQRIPGLTGLLPCVPCDTRIQIIAHLPDAATDEIRTRVEGGMVGAAMPTCCRKTVLARLSVPVAVGVFRRARREKGSP
jgi:hypothetical protein